MYIVSTKINIHRAKKEQHSCISSDLRNHYSELFTQMAALKFDNTVTQPP